MNEIIEITGIGSQMQGVGRLSDGRVAFVPFAMPGECVEIAYEESSGRFVNARLTQVKEPSPDRVEPDCPYYGQCGGCQARHMTYDRALKLKRQIVYDALTRIGGFADPDVRETVGSEKTSACRNKAEYPVAGGQIGAFAAGSHRVVPLEHCLLQADESNRALRCVAEAIRRGELGREVKYLVTRINRKGEMMLTLAGDAPQAPKTRFWQALPEVKSVWYCRLQKHPKHALDGVCTHIFGEKTLTETLMGLEFSVSPQSFFQVNAPQTEKLYTFALEAAGLTEDGEKTVLDAYCGAGTISLAAAKRAKRVLGVEIVVPAVQDAVENARRNGMADRAQFVAADAAKEIPRRIRAGERFDAIILDPPRKGADAALLESICLAAPKNVAYVSCDPGTLARDLKILAAGGYALQWAQPVDMFPGTMHVETVVLLSRAKADDYVRISVHTKDLKTNMN